MPNVCTSPHLPSCNLFYQHNDVSSDDGHHQAMYQQQQSTYKPVDARPSGVVGLKPNPVEPDSLLKPAARQDTFQYSSSKIVNDNSKSNDGKAFDLPKLPVRTAQAKRTRLPPTLSGLHQPPPDAGLLPSISVDKPDLPPAINVAASLTTTPPTAKPQRKARTGRRRWSDEETRHLIQGVSRFGIGNWTKILRCPDYKFDNRTAMDLKDRFRVCTAKTKSSIATSQSEDVLDLGTRMHFPRSTRRERHNFSALEDENLLRGFKKYGKSWSSIQQDTTLGLEHRMRTDLRDRMRNKYPEMLKQASVQERPEVLETSPQGLPRHAPPPPLQGLGSWMATDQYLDLGYDADESQAITLDRGILDWPFNTTTVPPNIDALPGRPEADTTALPSLASVTAASQSMNDRNVRELPALAQFLTPPIELDNRSNAHAFLSLDELLS